MKKDEVRKILTKIKGNYPASFTKITKVEAEAMLETWCEGLEEVDPKFAELALKDVLFRTDSNFAPTIGQFLARVEYHREEHERQHPTIRNAWEMRS